MLGGSQISSEFKFIYHYHNVLGIVVTLCIHRPGWMLYPPPNKDPEKTKRKAKEYW